MVGHRLRKWSLIVFSGLLLSLSACSDHPWNHPYPASEFDSNTLYSSFSERPEHLDPARSYSANEYAIIGAVYEPPLQYHYLKRPYTLTPMTARSVPQPELYDANGQRLPPDAPPDSVDCSVYEVSVQPGVRYQPHPAFAKADGDRFLYHQLDQAKLEGISSPADFKYSASRELVAADYIYQIKRLAHPRLHSPIFGLMSQYIKGLDKLYQDLKNTTRAEGQETWIDLRNHQLEGIEEVDRYTYRIFVNGKYPQFIYWLSMPFFAPMPWEVERFYHQPILREKNITLDWFPVGTGAYMLAENNPNKEMVLVRNSNYHGALYPDEGELGDAAAGLLDDAGKRLPFIDRIVFSLEKENIPYWNKFLQGYYDSSGIPSDSFDQAISIGAGGEMMLTKRMRKKGIDLKTTVAASTFYAGFNMLDPVVGGDSERATRLRQAISIAVDYEEYIAIFRNGRGISGQGPLPPGIFGYREGREGINETVYDWVNDRPRRKSLAQAKRLMAEAGYPDGLEPQTGERLLLYLDTTGSGPDSKANLAWWRKQFRKLNIQLVIRNTDYNRFQEKMLKGTAQIFQWGWNADYPDPENFLFLLYGPNAKKARNGENAANYANPEYDALFEQMKNSDNDGKRQAIIDSMLSIVRNDSPWLWGFHPKEFTLHHEWYKNVKPHLFAQNTLAYKRIDRHLRAAKRMAWNRPVLWPLWLLLALISVAILPAIWSYWRKVHLPPRAEMG